MTVPVTKYPNTELVAVAWLKDLFGANAGMAGTTLPADNSTWAASGFAQVTALTGATDPYIAMRWPVITIDTWACNRTGNKPPWAKAANLAETIIIAGIKHRPRRIVLPSPYPNAQLFVVDMTTAQPRRVRDDAGYARYNFNCRMTWSAVTL